MGVPCAARFSKSWPYFRPKNVIFHTRFQTRPLKSILVFRQKLCHHYLAQSANRKFFQSISNLHMCQSRWTEHCIQPRSQSSSAISDVTSPAKLVGKIRRGLFVRFQASSGHSDNANRLGYELHCIHIFRGAVHALVNYMYRSTIWNA